MAVVSDLWSFPFYSVPRGNFCYNRTKFVTVHTEVHYIYARLQGIVSYMQLLRRVAVWKCLETTDHLYSVEYWGEQLFKFI